MITVRARWSIVCVTASLIISTAARAEGIDIGRSWASCVVDTSQDSDRDGLDDECESNLARSFQPQLVFSSLEDASARWPYWAARQVRYRWVRVFYALAYERDTGFVTTGFLDHLGDTEFVVLDISNRTGNSWVLEEAFLSAHFRAALTDSSGWYRPDAFAYVGGLSQGRPVVWVSAGKHANYPSLSTCLVGALGSEWCGDSWREDLFPLLPVGRDLGLSRPDQQIAEPVDPVGDQRQLLLPVGDNYSCR